MKKDKHKNKRKGGERKVGYWFSIPKKGRKSAHKRIRRTSLEDSMDLQKGNYYKNKHIDNWNWD